LGAGGARHDDVISDVLTQFALSDRAKPVDVVSEIARLHGLLDLAWTDDVQVLYDRLSGAASDVVLSETDEAAYQRTANRLNGMWELGDGLSRFLY
jgi:hypothetical protein